MSTARQRADLLVVAQQLAASRKVAQAMIMAGQIVEGPAARRIDKPGTLLPVGCRLTRRGIAPPFVSRAGQKLQAALDHFGVCPRGWRCVDVGASTGGFTDCLLQAGATHVTAIDVGRNQLAWRLRQHSQVTSIEGCNVRHAPPGLLPLRCRLAVMDVSFISVTALLPAVLPWLRSDGQLMILVKPQFEAGRAAVGRGGLVRCARARAAAVAQVVGWCEAHHLRCQPPLPSPLLGTTGNQEYLLWARCAPAASKSLPSPPSPIYGALGDSIM